MFPSYATHMLINYTSTPTSYDPPTTRHPLPPPPPSTRHRPHRAPAPTDTRTSPLINSSDHNVPHNLVRDAHHVTATLAYGSASVGLEPTEHSVYSPGKRLDIYLPELATIIDAKVGRPVKASAHLFIQARSTHTPFALNCQHRRLFFAISLGRSQRNFKGDGPFNPIDASGYVPAVRGEYAPALGKG